MKKRTYRVTDNNKNIMRGVLLKTLNSMLYKPMKEGVDNLRNLILIRSLIEEDMSNIKYIKTCGGNYVELIHDCDPVYNKIVIER